jgi:hypothetical protein
MRNLISVEFHIEHWHALVHAIIVLGDSVHCLSNVLKN